MSDEAKLVLVLEASSRKLQNELVRTNRLIDRFADQTERRFTQMNKKNEAAFIRLGASVRGSLGGLQDILGPLAGALSVREVLRYANAWQEAENKLAAASTVGKLQARSLGELKDAANGARSSLEVYVDLYARLLRVAPMVTASEEQVARVTQIVAESLKAGGASAQEQQSALIQLGQALGSGVLQGDELRALRENAPLLAASIAKEFKVSIGELKQLGAEGKLTSERVFKAILAGGAEIDAAFKSTNVTVSDAFTRIENDFTAYIGTAGNASGATHALIDALNFLADNFKTVGDAVVTFALVLAGALAGKAIAGVVVGLGEAVVALATFLSAMASGTLTVATFSAALGPIALLASAAAVAFGLFIYQMGESERVTKAHTAALTQNGAAIEVAADASKEYRDSLRRQISMQLEAAKAALQEAKAQTIAAAQKAAVLKSLSGLPGFGVFAQVGGDAFGAMAGEAAKTAAENQKFIDQLTKQLDALNALGEGKPGSGNGGTGGSSEKANEWSRRRDAVIDATEALIKETEAQKKLNPLVNDYGFAVTKAKYAAELLAAAQDAFKNDPKKFAEAKQQIDFLAEGYANASVEAEKLKESQGEVADQAKAAFADLRDVTQGWIKDLLDGKSATEALGNALSNIGDRLINLGLDTLFGTGSGSNPYGAIGKLFGFAKGGIAAHGRPQMFASGGISRSAAVFGEAGPEAAVPLPDGRRIPVDLRMPSGGSSGSITAPVSIKIDARGADAAGLARVERQLAQLKNDIPHVVVGTVRTAQKRRML